MSTNFRRNIENTHVSFFIFWILEKMSKILDPNITLNAYKRLQGIVSHTPTLHGYSFFNDHIDANVYFKCENLQKVILYKIIKWYE